ncbi:DUF4871 domain-containing protein [Priestia megaterium]|uniref:DUF4871 domain-containing protein n=1 Tax=Priestia megaterium TaxID=1404 RepID=UPI001FB41153|nr:DUF4871 domain-containing protein [Priestia megaterium]
MKIRLKNLMFFLVLIVVLSSCSSKKDTSASEVVAPTNLEDAKAPSFVKQDDFNNINWDDKNSTFKSENISMFGHKNKLGIIGSSLETDRTLKWFWNFWGVKNGKLTVVAYHKETTTISSMLMNSNTNKAQWSQTEIGGPTNGADATLPTTVKLSKPGKWALLVYLDDQLFDTIVIKVKE